MNLSCAKISCQLPRLSQSDGRIEIKAVLPSNWSSIKNPCVRWKCNGEAAFHVECWSEVLKMARSRNRGGSSRRKESGRGSASPANPTPAMKQTEKLMIVNAAKTLEKFDSLEDIKSSAKRAAALILNANHCIAFTGAGISTSAGLGDFRGKSGKWTEQDQSAVDGVIQAAFQMDTSHTSACSAEESMSEQKKRGRGDQSKVTTKRSLSSTDVEHPSEFQPHSVPGQTSADDCDGSTHTEDHGDVNPEPPKKRHKSCVKDENAVKQESSNIVDHDTEEPEENVDYENLRPTYTHEALTLLMERGLLQYVVSQNCDGLHLLSGISPDHISELHGNVFVEKCPRCKRRYSRDFYVLHDEASQYYEELEDHGETEMAKPKFAAQCHLCGLCHRTGRRCEEKGCNGYLEDTIINFRDNLEEAGLDRAWEESGKSDVILCLGTTLMVTPACDIVDEAEGKEPLIICNRQKTAKDHLAKVRVFGDCDIFMAEVLAHLLDKEDKRQWEEKRGERMEKYNLKRLHVAAH